MSKTEKRKKKKKKSKRPRDENGRFLPKKYDDKKVQQKSTEDSEAGFKPRPIMIKWLQTAFELGYGASITAIAEEAEVDRTNWYNWIKDPKFVDWWDSQWQQYLKLNRWKLDAIGMQQAKDNYDYWQTMMERTGNIEKEAPTNNQFNQFNFPDAYVQRITEE